MNEEEYEIIQIRIDRCNEYIDIMKSDIKALKSAPYSKDKVNKKKLLYMQMLIATDEKNQLKNQARNMKYNSVEDKALRALARENVMKFLNRSEENE